MIGDERKHRCDGLQRKLYGKARLSEPGLSAYDKVWQADICTCMTGARNKGTTGVDGVTRADEAAGLEDWLTRLGEEQAKTTGAAVRRE